MRYLIRESGDNRDYRESNKRRAFVFARMLAANYQNTVSVYDMEELIAQWRWTPERGGRVYRCEV